MTAKLTVPTGEASTSRAIAIGNAAGRAGSAVGKSDSVSAGKISWSLLFNRALFYLLGIFTQRILYFSYFGSTIPIQDDTGFPEVKCSYPSSFSLLLPETVQRQAQETKETAEDQEETNESDETEKNQLTHLQKDHSSCEAVRQFQSVFEPLGTDKTSLHGYHWFYGPKLHSYQIQSKKKEIHVLEIGAHDGLSIAGWTRYFDKVKVDTLTYGGNHDILNFARKECELGICEKVGERYYGDQSDTDFLDTVIAQRPRNNDEDGGGWDIIIDDASHVPAHNVITFEHLWKKAVKPGGIYIVEDLETSYYPNSSIYNYLFQAGILAPPPLNSIKRFQKYVDVINRGYFVDHGKWKITGTPRTNGYENKNFFSLFDGDDSIQEIGFARNVMYVKKAQGKNECVDNSMKTYYDYPYNPFNLEGKDDIFPYVEKAKKRFDEQSKVLDSWRTAPSFLEKKS